MKYKGIKKEKYVLTYEQIKELEDELIYLRFTKRKEINAKIREIREQGGTDSNRQYSDAKSKQRRNEARISEIEYILGHAEIGIENELTPTTVILGSKVLLHDKEYDEKIMYTIVDTADVNSLKNIISDQSPLGKALLGKKVGEKVTVQVGNMNSTYEILSIEGVEFGYAQKLQIVSGKSMSTISNTSSNIREVKDILPKDFVTRVNVFKCTADNHRLIDINCRIKVLSQKGKIESYTVPGAYCKTCNRYFMLEMDYKRLKAKGILVCKVVEKDYWMGQGKQDNDFNLNQESLLHIMGYNVSAQADLSNEQRWTLLELFVDEGILTVAEIRSHLNWLIRRNINNRNFDDARIKWEIDSNHLMNYASKSQPAVEVGSITSKNYRK